MSVAVGADGTDITSVSVSGVGDGSADVSGSGAFDPGAVPIAEDGTFSTYIDAGGSEVIVSGAFDGSTLDGSLLISPSTCGSLSFPPPS